MKYTFSLFITAVLSLSISANAQVWKINTVAGNGTQSFSGDGLVATGAGLSGPIAVGIDSAGNFYIAEIYNSRIRKVNTAGVISTIAGNGSTGTAGDNSVATSAELDPRGMAVNKQGDVFIADANNARIRKVNHTTGIITRYAGNGTYGHSGDGGSALGASLTAPYGLCLDAAGNLYIADVGAHVVRKITPAGIISTVAGNDTAGYSGDFGYAIAARLDSPFAVTVDRIGNLYISDHRNNVIRKVDTAHIITTIVGTYNTYGHTGDGGPAVLSTLNGPKGLFVDSIRNLYICDADNHVIRKVDTFGNISTIVGTGSQGFGGDLSVPTGALLNNPYDIKIDKNGSMFIADANNQRIRKVYNPVLLGVNNVANTSNITVYPNPANDNITVSGLVAADEVVVYEITGRQLMSFTTKDGRPFIVRSLSAGTYILKVFDAAGNTKTTVKMVKE